MPRLSLPLVALVLAAPTAVSAQQVPASGSFGLEVFGLTETDGSNALWLSSKAGAAGKLVDLPAPPSRWLHRRRHMAAEEAALAFDDSNGGIVLFVPTGDAASNGGLTVVDARSGIARTDVPLVAPAAYDPLLVPTLAYVICASDDGQGGTALEVVSYAVVGGAVSLGRTTVTGPPAGGVTRMHTTGTEVLVPTTRGVHILRLGASTQPLTPVALVDSGSRSPTTNLAAFVRNGSPHFAIMTADFGANNRPSDAAIVSFDAAGQAQLTDVGDVPNTSPPKPYVPAAGSHDPGIVTGGGLTYVAFLLREREPGTFFTKPAGVAVIGFGMPNDPTFAVVRTLPAAGEPFAEIAVHGARMAFLTSESPDWWPTPPGGSERINVLYTPLDPLGSGSVGGVIGSAGPLGGRIGVEVTDRPLWSRDGRSLFVTTVNYPGAPNPGLAGSEVLRVPADRAIDEVRDPMLTVLPMRDQIDERAYGLPTELAPRDLPASAFGDFTLFAQMAQTAAHGVMVPHNVSGYLATGTATPSKLPRDSNIPGFPAIPPRTFDDVNGSVVAPPPTWGSRRANFNLLQRAPTVFATYLVQPVGDRLLYQTTGFNLMGFFGEIPVLTVPLPAGSTTSTEILSF